jgi:hypothetical protein
MVPIIGRRRSACITAESIDDEQSVSPWTHTKTLTWMFRRSKPNSQAAANAAGLPIQKSLFTARFQLPAKLIR